MLECSCTDAVIAGDVMEPFKEPYDVQVLIGKQLRVAWPMAFQ